MSVRNIEVKARAEDLERVRLLASALGAVDQGVTRDVDTYSRVAQGRLKLRQSDGYRHGTLIHYERADLTESRPSDYTLLRVDEPDLLKSMLASALGLRIVVAKTRHLYLAGVTRIDLDRVESLGSFVELETVLTGQSESEAQVEHRFIRQALEIDQQQIIALSYSDLLLAAAED